MWKPPKIWDGGTCFIIGGGPSILTEFEVPDKLQEAFKLREIGLSALAPYMASIKDKHTIGINLAYSLGNWVDFVFFGDYSWFVWHRQELAKFTSLKVTCSPKFKDWSEDNVERIKYMPRNHEHKQGITTTPGYVSWNKNSGAASISLACQLGVSRIVLLGFDMDFDSSNKHTHWFGSHWEKVGGPFDRHGQRRKPPENNRNERAKGSFLHGTRVFDVIAEEAKELGVEIINASPNSAIQSLPKVSVSEVLEQLEMEKTPETEENEDESD